MLNATWADTIIILITKILVLMITAVLLSGSITAGQFCILMKAPELQLLNLLVVSIPLNFYTAFFFMRNALINQTVGPVN